MSLLKEYEGVVRGIAKKPDSRIIIEEALKKLDSDEKPFYIIRAPTGYGKTAFSYTLAIHALKDASRFEKVIHVLPLRSIIEDAYVKASFILYPFVGRQMMGLHEDPFLLRTLTFTTVDTFIYDLMKLNTVKSPAVRRGKEYGYDYFTQASISLSAVVLDEAHIALEDEIMSSAFLTALYVMIELEVPIFIMTATMSKYFANQLRDMAERQGYSFRVLPEFESQVDDDYFARERSKNFAIYLVDDTMPENLVKEGKRNLIVLNTVREAQRVYSTLKKRGLQPILIHSRFTSEDRKKKMKKLEKIKEEKEWIIVSTQVIEAGVDLSSDVLITELAPLSSLIQRMGRNARFDERYGEIYILKKEECKPYPIEICRKTLEELSKIGNPLKIHPRDPQTYQNMIDSIYKIIQGRVESRLSSFMLDPLVRSDEMLYYLDELTKDRNFLREYPVPLRIGEDYVPVTWQILESMIRERPGCIQYCTGICRDLEENEVRKAVLEVASWKGGEIRLKDECVKLFYDPELGLSYDPRLKGLEV